MEMEQGLVATQERNNSAENGFDVEGSLSVQKLANSEQGFTLLEILIVLGIMGGLIAAILTAVGGSSEAARKKEAATKASMIQQALIRYQVDMGKMPTGSEGLDVLVTNPGSNKWSGPYVEGDQIKDPWGTPYAFELTPKGPKLTSAGKDAQMGTGDDLPFINGTLVEEAAPAEGGAAGEGTTGG